MTLQLTIKVNYRTSPLTGPLPAVQRGDLAARLRFAAQHLEDNGLLTGDTDYEVESFTYQVAEVLP